MTLDILRMDVTKELLRKMEKEERALFLALGHASNQVNALWKLVIILTNGDTDDPVKQRLEGTQTQVFVRLTIGAMWEAWRLVEDRFLKRPLGREYLPLLDRPAADALERLKKRFGKGSGLSTIRNNYAFHHPGIDDIDAAFEKWRKRPAQARIHMVNSLAYCAQAVTADPNHPAADSDSIDRPVSDPGARGVVAEVQYAGAAPGLIAGVIQVNILIPAEAPSGEAVPITLTIGQTESRAGVTMAIR